ARRAVVAGKGAERVPGNLRVVMAVVVDKTGGDDLAADIDRLPARAGQLAHLDDLAVLDRDIAVERGHARAVDDAAGLQQDVIGHRFPPAIPRELLRIAATITRRPRLSADFSAPRPCNSRTTGPLPP